jgi:adenosylmethionine-8-amino-7-oxononanoate aminotransferase
VRDVRVIGAIGVVELYDNIRMEETQNRLIEMGVWLRPYGKLLYTMPPFITSNKELYKITDAIKTVVHEL